jgi:uncharacterized protein (TIGR00730 family)
VVDPAYFDAADSLATILLQNNIAVNYGGGRIGLMGKIADTIIAGGGKITGFIPVFMKEMEWAHEGIVEMVLVRDMHERKYLMRKNVDAIIALPGGVGTLEELLEVITLKQLGQFTKPIIIVNTNDFYAPLLDLLSSMIRLKFMRDIHENLWQVVNDPADILDAINNSPVWDTSAIKFAAVARH